MPGRVFGEVAGGLRTATSAGGWLDRRHEGAARAGASGELRCAEILDPYGSIPNGPTVMHDLMVPSNKYRANIDHLVVAGTTVHIFDAKVWKPGRYWTLGERSFRGFERFRPAEKQTLVVAAKCVEAYLRSRGIRQAMIAEPIVVVWPSSTAKKMHLGLLRFPGSRVVPSARFGKVARRQFKRALPADPLIVSALMPLLTTNPAATG